MVWLYYTIKSCHKTSASPLQKPREGLAWMGNWQELAEKMETKKKMLGKDEDGRWREVWVHEEN